MKYKEFDDYPILKVSGSVKERLLLALNLAHWHQAAGYFSTKKELVFYWTVPSDTPKFMQFPFKSKMEIEGIADFIFLWLKNEAEYDREPDHDGDNSKGWLLQTESWGQIEGYGSYSFLKITPHWIMHGK